MDSNNNVIVSGTSYGSGNSGDYLTIKYSSAGVPLWTNRFNGPVNGEDQATSRTVAVDSSNNVIVSGSVTVSGGYQDCATVKYSSAGVPLWTNYFNGPANGYDGASSVVVDHNNNVIVTGGCDTGGFIYDYATIQYSSAGVPLWTNRYNGPGNGSDTASAVVVDRSGNVIVTGASGSGGVNDFATVKYICVPSPVLSGLQHTNGTFQTRVDDILQPGTLVIEASTNLTSWSPIFTNTTPTNVLFYADPTVGNLPARFYRAFQFP